MASYLLSPPPSYTSSIGSPTSPLYYEDNESSIDIQKSNDQHNTDFNFVDDNEWLLSNNSYENQHVGHHHTKQINHNQQLLSPPTHLLTELTLHDYVRQTAKVPPLKNQIPAPQPRRVSRATKVKKKQNKSKRRRQPLKAKHSNNNIKRASHESKEWLKNAKAKHKLSEKSKMSTSVKRNGSNSKLIISVNETNRKNQLKPLDRNKLGYRSLPQSREFPNHQYNKRIEKVRRLTYTHAKDEEHFKRAEEFMNRRRSQRANNLLLKPFKTRVEQSTIPIKNYYKDYQIVNNKRNKSKDNLNIKHKKVMLDSMNFYDKVANELKKHIDDEDA